MIVYHVADRSVLYSERLVDGRVFALDWLGDREEFAVGGDGAVLTVVDPAPGPLAAVRSPFRRRRRLESPATPTKSTR